MRLKIPIAAAALVAAGLSGFLWSVVAGTPPTFDLLLMRQAALTVLQQPELMARTGLGGWFDTGDLGSYSLAGREAQYAQLRRFRSEILRWDRTALDPQAQTTYDMLLWSDERRLAFAKYAWLGADEELYPVNAAFGVQKFLPMLLLSDQPIADAAAARRQLARLKEIGPLLASVAGDVRRQAALGVVPPDFIIDESIAQMNAFVAPSPRANVLVTSFAAQVAALGLDGTVANRLVADAAGTVRNGVYPAYRRLIAEERTLRRDATHDAGVWRLKGGADYYADALKYLTSTNLGPDAIHEIGRGEVARITGELDTHLKAVGLADGSVGARLASLMRERRFLFANTPDGRARMLARYRQLLDRASAILPRYFRHVPSTALVLRAVPAFAQKESAGAYYEPPSFDGTRPGAIVINVRDIAETPQWAMPTLAFHEGIPGHHLQTASEIENPQLPLLRRLQSLPSFDEGWALYAEHLAAEAGLYRNDPYGDIGRLQSELFRASRLVVDTGIHAKRWSREQAIAYLQATTGLAPAEVAAEVDRYTVWPGQACAYTIGVRTILDLRAEAMAELGPAFDLREFHAQILDNGALPLWLLQRNMARWIEANRSVYRLSSRLK